MSTYLVDIFVLKNLKNTSNKTTINHFSFQIQLSLESREAIRWVKSTQKNNG